MKSNRIVLTGVAMSLGTVMAASAPAHAANERKLLVLIDASFSMTTTRTNSDGKGSTRFEAARSFAVDQINFYESQVDPPSPGNPTGRPLRVAVYTFRGDDTLPVVHTNGPIGCTPGLPLGSPGACSPFVPANAARDTINCLIPDPTTLLPGLDCTTTFDAGVGFDLGSPAGNTPLARALCSTADILAAAPAGDARLMELTSDGEENSTTSAPCAPNPGVVGVFTPPPPPPGTWGPPESWQARIITHFTSLGIQVRTDLLETPPLPIPTLATQRTPDPEGILTPEARLLAITPSASTGLNSLEQFFTSLAQLTGGRLTIIHDDQPLPVTGDENGDRCIDHTDAIPVARAFGPIVPPAVGTFDLNADGVVDFNDYLFQLSLISGTCGKNPYVSRSPLVCKGEKRVVIDGQSIEDRGISIDARGSCEITIKNSLIVSGKNAISIVGEALVNVDNSIIVGEDAVLTTHGETVLSASNTVFHGDRKLGKCFKYIDRGGNIWESPDGPPASQRCDDDDDHEHGDHDEDHGHEGHGEGHGHGDHD